MHYINNNIKLIWYIRKLICLFWRLVKMEMENFESSPLFPCNFIKGQCTVCSDFAVHLRHQWISSTFTRDSFLYVWFNRRVKRFGNHFSLGVISIPKAWESNLVAWFATCTARKDYSLSSHRKRVVHALGNWEFPVPHFLSQWNGQCIRLILCPFMKPFWNIIPKTNTSLPKFLLLPFLFLIFIFL